MDGEHFFKVRRLCLACCGMENDRIYQAVTRDDPERPVHVRVRLPDGTWTTPHAFEGFFEKVPDNADR